MSDYKLVPVEPTAHMLQAACDEEQRPLPMWIRMKAIYTAMLAAAPAVQGEAVEYGWRLIAVNEAWDALERALSRACNKGYMPVTMGAEWNAFDWTEAPQPTEQQPAADVEGLVEALEDMLSGWKYIRESHGDLYGVGWDRAENKARAALAAHRNSADKAKTTGD